MQIVLERGADEILRTLVESAPEAIVVFNETGRFELVNENAVRLFGRSRRASIRNQSGEQKRAITMSGVENPCL